MIRLINTVVKSVAVLCFLVGVSVALDGILTSAEARKRSLTLYNTHTGETQTITFKRNGRYIESGLRELNRFARDWRRNESTKMDPALFDLIWEVYQEVGARKPIYLVSGYRSPATNEMLRSRSSGVARKSRHTSGQAIDFYIPGVPLKKLREAALKRQAGGVGYYPKSGSPFVHLDTGNIRHWPKMTRRQLLALFPDGKTLHLPSDGKPLKGYQQALAAYKKGTLGSGTRVAAAPTPSSKATNNSALAANGRATTQQRNGVLAGLFNNGRNRAEANAPSGPTPPANVASAPSGVTAVPVNAARQSLSTNQSARQVAQLSALPKARPAAVIQLAARLSTGQEPVDGALQSPQTAPFQIASAETQQLIATGASALSLAQTTSDTPLDARGRIAAAALQSASQRRLSGQGASFVTAAAPGAAGQPGTNTASPLASETGFLTRTPDGLSAATALGFMPKARPGGDGGLAFDGIDGTITSAPAPVGALVSRSENAAELDAERLNPSALSGNSLTADLAGNVPSTVLTYTGLNDDLPPIPEPASVASALPEQSLTLPVSASATATISAQEIAEIFAGNGEEQSQVGPNPTVASRFDDAMTIVAQRSYDRHVHMISRLLTGELSGYARLVHPDQRSLAPLLAPTPLSHATSRFGFSVSTASDAFSARPVKAESLKAESLKQAMR